MNKKLFFILLCCAFFIEFSHANSQYHLLDDIPIQRVRIDFTAPTGYVRHLLLAFTPHNEATDGVDYGYDSLNMDILPFDLNWLIEDGKYIIQGVGEYKEERVYPLGLFMSETGEVDISLADLENFESEIPVYLFDSYTKEFTLLNDSNYVDKVDKGDYLDRYFIAFSNSTNTLSTVNTIHDDNLKIYMSSNSSELVIAFGSSEEDVAIKIYNAEGKEFYNSVYTDISKVNLPAYIFSSRVAFLQINVRQSTIARTILLP